jgi:hypothetical protein
MVFAVDPASLISMVTGRYDESRSPEALNARPFLRARPKPVLTIARPPSSGARRKGADAAESPPIAPSPDRAVAQPTATAASGDVDPPASAFTVAPAAVHLGDDDVGRSARMTIPARPGSRSDEEDVAGPGDAYAVKPMNRETEEGR